MQTPERSVSRWSGLLTLAVWVAVNYHPSMVSHRMSPCLFSIVSILCFIVFLSLLLGIYLSRERKVSQRKETDMCSLAFQTEPPWPVFSCVPDSLGFQRTASVSGCRKFGFNFHLETHGYYCPRKLLFWRCPRALSPKPPRVIAACELNRWWHRSHEGSVSRDQLSC